MRPEEVYKALSFLSKELGNKKVNWVLVGSLNLFLQGVDVNPHDVDISTDKKGASVINKVLKNYMIEPIKYSETETFKSFRGIFKIHNCLVDVVTNLQYRPSKHSKWFKSTSLSAVKTLKYRDLLLPVVPLEQEYKAYLKMGRLDKAEKIKAKLKDLQTI